MQKLPETKKKDKITAQETYKHQKQLLASNDDRDSENQAISYRNGKIECQRYDEKQASCKSNSETEILRIQTSDSLQVSEKWD